MPHRVGAYAPSCDLLSRGRRQPDGDRLSAAVDVQLRVGAVEVVLDRTFRQEQMLGDPLVGHTGRCQVEDLSLPFRDPRTQRVARNVMSGRIEHDIGGFLTEHQASVAAGLNGAGHLVDAQLTVNQVASRSRVECLADSAGVSIRSEHNDRGVGTQFWEDVKSAAPRRHGNVK